MRLSVLLVCCFPLLCWGKWSVVIDAGSTGSRLHLFRYTGGKLVAETLGKVEPGLSSFAQGGTSKHSKAIKSIENLLKRAADRIKSTDQGAPAPVPLLVRATAGMRLVPEADQTRLYAAMRSDFATRVAPSLPVKFSLSIETITGKQEAFFGFVSANFLGSCSFRYARCLSSS